MTDPIFTFDTTHHALWAEEIARERGLAHEVVPAPSEANARCDIAIATLEGDRPEFSAALDGSGIDYRIYRPSS